MDSENTPFTTSRIYYSLLVVLVKLNIMPTSTKTYENFYSP
jgi:hypothetical protein